MKLILHDLTKEQCQQTGLDSLSKEDFKVIKEENFDLYSEKCFSIIKDLEREQYHINAYQNVFLLYLQIPYAEIFLNTAVIKLSF